MSEAIVFLASLAPSEGAIKIHGVDGYRITFDAPNDELGAIMQLALRRGRVLRIAVTDEGEQPPRAKPKAKRKRGGDVPEWGDDDTGDHIG